MTVVDPSHSVTTAFPVAGGSVLWVAHSISKSSGILKVVVLEMVKSKSKRSTKGSVVKKSQHPLTEFGKDPAQRTRVVSAKQIL